MKHSASLAKLISLAKIARKRVEALSYAENGPAHLQGYCGIASRYLELLGHENGIETELVVGHFRSYNRTLNEYIWRAGHCWIEYDNRIIDITATQFRNISTKVNRDFGQKVYMSENTNPHYWKEATGEVALSDVCAWYCEPLDEICRSLVY